MKTPPNSRSLLHTQLHTRPPAPPTRTPFGAPEVAAILLILGLILATVVQAQQTPTAEPTLVAMAAPSTQTASDTSQPSSSARAQMRALMRLKLRYNVEPAGLSLLTGEPSSHMRRVHDSITSLSNTLHNPSAPQPNPSAAPSDPSLKPSEKDTSKAFSVVSSRIHNALEDGGLSTRTTVIVESNDDAEDEEKTTPKNLVAELLENPVDGEKEEPKVEALHVLPETDDVAHKDTPVLPVAGAENPSNALKGALHRPLIFGRIHHAFGQAPSENSKTHIRHTGWTIRAPRGHRVRAAHGGEVVFSGPYKGYGKMVVVDHGEGMHTVYSGLQSFQAIRGMNIKRGQPVGVVGSGQWNGNLYFELRLHGKPVDPEGWFSKEDK